MTLLYTTLVYSFPLLFFRSHLCDHRDNSHSFPQTRNFVSFTICALGSSSTSGPRSSPRTLRTDQPSLTLHQCLRDHRRRRRRRRGRWWWWGRGRKWWDVALYPHVFSCCCTLRFGEFLFPAYFFPASKLVMYSIYRWGPIVDGLWLRVYGLRLKTYG